MRFSLSFDMDGAAFDGGDNSVDEVVRILHTLAGTIDAQGTTDNSRGSNVYDVNGDHIGSWEVTEEDEYFDIDEARR
jgi:hypothetical protein